MTANASPAPDETWRAPITHVGLSVDGRHITVDFEGGTKVHVEIDYVAVNYIARRAVRNRSRRCKSGPLLAKVVRRG